MRIKAVLVDIDGTLVDSNERHVRAWERAFRESGFDVPSSAIRQQIGKGADHLVPFLLPDATDALAARLGDEHGRIFKDAHLERVLPFAGARDLLARIHESGRAVVLASSASQEELDHYIDLMDVAEFVSATTSIDDVRHSKPDGDIFRAALANLGDLPSDRAVVVGDTPYDVEAADSCGVPSVAVRSGGFSDRDLSGAVAIYDDVAALLADFGSSVLDR